MSYCPRAFNEDMTDPRNIVYCREIQRKNGETCRKRKNRCRFYTGGMEGGGEVHEGRGAPAPKRSSQERLF